MISMLQKSFEYEKAFESERWIEEIPYLNFKPEWKVKVIPPFCGAVVRFRIDYNDIELSVYLDCYDNLGSVGQPYWELYPYVNDDTFRCLMNDTDELLHAIEISLNNKPNQL